MKLIQYFRPAPTPDPRIDQVLSRLARLEKLMSQLDDKITQLQNDVAAEKTVETSAIALLNGIGAQIKAAVDAALASGATAEQLQSLTDLSTAVEGQTQDLAAAVAGNVKTAPPPPPPSA